MRPLAAATAVAIFALGIDRSAIAEPESTGSVVVHIDSPEPVELQRATDDKRNPFSVVCASPCDEAMPTGGKYRISGDSIRYSRRFVLPEHVARDVIVVKPASSAAFQVGIILISVGGLSLGIGLLVMLESALGDDPSGPSDNGRSYHAGLALAAGGVAAAIGGIVLAVVNGRTHLRQTSEAASRPVPTTEFRASAWRAGPRREGTEPPTWSVPFVSAAF